MLDMAHLERIRMFINKVLSYHNAWRKLQEEYSAILDEIRQVVIAMHSERKPMDLTRAFTHHFTQFNWNKRVIGTSGNNQGNTRVIELVKNGMGIELDIDAVDYICIDA
jgi:hypothetical protein